MILQVYSGVDNETIAAAAAAAAAAASTTTTAAIPQRRPHIFMS